MSGIHAAARAGLNMHFIARQHGMFSLLDLTDVEIDSLRREHGIYIAPGGRINVAGLNDATIARFVGALDTLQKAA